MKRTRDTLTGGTGDVNPQWLILPNMPLPAANAYTQLTVPLPTNRLPLSKGKAMVMEVLKVFWDLPSYGSAVTTGIKIIQAQAQLSTAPLSSIQHSSASVFAYASRKWREWGADTADSGALATVWYQPEIQDFTDGAGHGLLIATDNAYFAADTTNFTASVSFGCRILYRWKEVGLTEYIGMVQSQQMPGLASGA